MSEHSSTDGLTHPVGEDKEETETRQKCALGDVLEMKSSAERYGGFPRNKFLLCYEYGI